MSDDEPKFQVHVSFHGGGMLTADSMDEAEEIAKDTDWSANGISMIVIEDLETGREREVVP